MKCPSIDILQAYIDGELEIEIKKKVENHIINCSKCSLQYKTLKENDNMVFDAIGKYKNYIDDNMKVQLKPLKAGESVKDAHESKDSSNRFTSFIVKYKKIAAAFIAVALISSYVAIGPVRAAVSDMLSIFRAENLTGINLTMQDLNDIQKKLQNKSPEIAIKDMGKISVSGGEQKRSSLKEVQDLEDFRIQLPEAFKNSTPEIDITKPMSVSFNLNAKKVNSAMKAFGATELLPDNISGKTFELRTPLIVNASYFVSGKVYNILQTRAPQIVIPDGVDADKIYNAMVKFPILPDSIQKQLKAVKDWRKTLFVPVVDSKTEEVDINGVRGYLYPEIGYDNGTNQSAIIWSDNGIIKGITGNLSRNELIKLAESMR
jgi:transcription elongation factor Elf1